MSVGISFDTAQFLVASILAWWQHLGRQRFPAAFGLLITADCGGSNANRSRLWKVELGKLADLIGMPITVCHFPPGTSKWNRIEHRLFSHISMNWRGKPLISHQVIISLISATTTRSGLKVHARIDDREYHKGIKISDAQLAAVNITRHDFHPDWNYLDFRGSESGCGPCVLNLGDLVGCGGLALSWVILGGDDWGSEGDRR